VRAVLSTWVVGLVLSWGVFSFGGVYQWGYLPLLAAAAAIGATGLFIGNATVDRVLIASLVVIAVATGIQLVPIQLDTLAAISPQAVAIHRQRDLGVAIGSVGAASISIDPARTVAGVGFLLALTLFIAGLTKMLTRSSARRLATLIGYLGLVLAIEGIVQRAISRELIYGFWSPPQGGSPFGPFINRNHFAGWMLMAIPVTMGAFVAVLSRNTDQLRDTVKRRLLWLATPDANRIVLLSLAAGAMILAVLLTLSRSGIAALALAISGTLLFVARGEHSSRRRMLVIGYLAAVVLLAIAWIGIDRIESRLQENEPEDIAMRVEIWNDSLRIVKDFWPAGTGLNTFGTATLFYQASVPGKHLREAHNDYLQLAAEGGLLVGVPVLISVIAFLRAVRRRFATDSGSARWIRLGAAAGVAAIATQSLVEFSLQIPANSALFSVLLALSLHDSARTSTAH
jgi:putative inorganic carbon (HCO3(-)) transporter